MIVNPDLSEFNHCKARREREKRPSLHQWNIKIMSASGSVLRSLFLRSQTSGVREGIVGWGRGRFALARVERKSEGTLSSPVPFMDSRITEHCTMGGLCGGCSQMLLSRAGLQSVRTQGSHSSLEAWRGE